MRILFTAMADSIHTARWISQINNQGWEIYVFDFKESGVNSELSGVLTNTVHPPTTRKNLIDWKSDYPLRKGSGFVKRFFPKIVNRYFFPDRVKSLAKIIRQLKPDIIHSLEMQNQSYPLIDVKNILGKEFSAPWIYSSWGSDIYFFGRHYEQADKIKSVLNECNYYIADCKRDVALAREFGFKGKVLGVYPVFGGIDVNHLRSFIKIGQTSQRKTIALKGYHNWAGRALVAIEALRLCKDLLKDYSIDIFLTSEEVEKAARNFSASSGVSVNIISQTKNIDIIKLFGRSRISIALSITDGSPTSMLESMIMGAFPIQSDTISTGEWINNGENGFLVPPEDAEAVAAAIKQALNNDELVNRAGVLNKKLMLEKVDKHIIQPQIVNLYENVYRDGAV